MSKCYAEENKSSDIYAGEEDCCINNIMFLNIFVFCPDKQMLLERANCQADSGFVLIHFGHDHCTR